MYFLIKDKLNTFNSYKHIFSHVRIIGEMAEDIEFKILLVATESEDAIFPENVESISNLEGEIIQCLGNQKYGEKLKIENVLCAHFGIDPRERTALIDEVVNRWFDRELKKGCLLSTGIKVDCKDKDISRWASTKVLMDTCGLTEIQIVDYNNQTVTLTSAQYLQLVLQVGSHFKDTLMTKNVKRNTAYSATTDIEFLRALLF